MFMSSLSQTAPRETQIRMDSVKTGQGRRLLTNQELFCFLLLFLKVLSNLIVKTKMNSNVMINAVKIPECPRDGGQGFPKNIWNCEERTTAKAKCGGSSLRSE